MGTLCVAIAAAGGAAWFVSQRGHTAEAARAVSSSDAPKYIVHLEEFTVNLADAENNRYLRTTIDLGVDRLPVNAKDNENAAAEIPVARVRDAILSVLTASKADELLSADGKIVLKKNILDAVNRSVPELAVREVYFSEFLVQR